MRLFLLLCLLLPIAARAQDDERLPDLTPREFEIRGELRIALPELQRQPLRGFAPPPRTYVVPGSRQPYVAPYAQRLDDLPPNPLPAPAQPALATAGAPRTGEIALGYGRYMSRLGSLTLSAGGFGLDFDYAGLSSWEPLSDADLEAPADALAGRLAFTTTGPVRLTFSADGAYDRYRLFGANPAAFPEAYPDRSGQTIGGSIAAEAAPGAPVPFRVGGRFASTTFGLDLDDDVPDAVAETLERDETRLEVEGAFGAGRLRLDAAGAFAGLDDEGIGESLTTYSAGGALDVPLGEGRLRLGARLLGYTTSDLNGGGSSTNVGPIVDFETPLSRTVYLFARNRPRVEARSLAGLFRENPYAVSQPLLAPDLYLADAEVGIEVQHERLRLRLFGVGRYSPVFGYFERGSDGLYAIAYDAATVFGAGASLTVYPGGGTSLTLSAEARDGALDAPDDDTIPYFAPVVGRLSLAVPFADGRGLFQAAGTAESTRPVGPDLDRAPAWADLDLEVGYRFAGPFGLFLRAEQVLGGPEQWPGFPRPGAVALLGLRAGW